MAATVPVRLTVASLAPVPESRVRPLTSEREMRPPVAERLSVSGTDWVGAFASLMEIEWVVEKIRGRSGAVDWLAGTEAERPSSSAVVAEPLMLPAVGGVVALPAPASGG